MRTSEELEHRATSRKSYRQAFLAGLRPEPRVTVSEWADRYRILTTRSSAEPGPWRTSRTPFVREIQDCLSSSSPVELLVWMKGSQVAGTEVGNNWVGYVIDHCPGPMMAVMPTEGVQRRKSRQTLDPLIEDTPRLAAKVSAKKSRDPGNTTLLKVFPGGILALASAMSAAELRSMVFRFLFLDEVDAFPEELPGEGDPVDLAERGSRTFSNRKVYMVSTPTVDGRSRIARYFQETDRRYYHVPCPHCGTFQRIAWPRIRWEQKDGEDPIRVAIELRERQREAWLECEACKKKIEEHEKTRMLEAGVWIPEDPSIGERVRGYHLSALYSPLGMYSWRDSVARFLKAQGKPARLRVWVNQDLGEVWKEKGDAPDWQRLYELRERYAIGVVPRGAYLLTCGADLQQDRLEFEVIAWGPGLESWSIEYGVRPYEKPAEWQAELDRLLLREWPHEEGPPSKLAGMAVDTGYEAQKVYQWARRYRRSSRVFCVKGRTGTRVPVGMPTAVDIEVAGRKIMRGVRLWPVDVGLLKEELYENLDLRPPVNPGDPYPEGFCHFPQYGAEYFKGLTAEHLVRRQKKGSGVVVLEWEKFRERNEPLDCRVYGRAVAHVLGADRWKAEDWAAVRLLAARMPTPPTPGTPPPPPPAGRPPPRRRDDGEDPWARFRKPT